VQDVVATSVAACVVTVGATTGCGLLTATLEPAVGLSGVIGQVPPNAFEAAYLKYIFSVYPSALRRVQLYQQEFKKLLPTLVIPVGRLNPEGIEVREEQLSQQEERKLPPTLVIPVGKLNPEGIEVKDLQLYQQ
jgi:hypothetical protein